jgi:hypothetical protein
MSTVVWVFRPGPARWMVNLRIANIFKGIFEMQKSTRNGKNNAKMRAIQTSHVRIYHVAISYIGALHEITDC